jgi:23S rRNA (uracil1939-C5)-methyltransferase
VPSPQATEYRALAKFVVGENGELGSYRPRSHEIVDMAGCVVHAPSIEKVASIVRENYSPNLELRYVIVRASLQQSLVIVTLIVRRDVGQSLNKLVDRLTELSEVAQIVMSVNDSDGDALIVPGDDVILYDGPSVAEQLGGAEQKLNSGAFSQINPGAAVGLYEQVVKCVDVQGKKFLDLYSGSGGISRALMLAGAASVHGVETNAQAVAAAKESSSTEDLSFEAASVEDVLDRLGDYDIIVVNPPRKGLSMAVVEALIELPKIDLVYVSCNPKSLARDVKLIEDNTEALIKRVVPVDMFPQTRHVETVLHLKS